jgi:hypothetical protein
MFVFGKLGIFMRKSLLAALFLLFNHVAYAQLDKEFWFAAPAISDDHSAENNCGCNDSNSNPSKGRCGAAPVSLNISNFYNYSTDVTIEIPADKFDPVLNPNGFKTINVTVPPNTTERVVLWDNDICDPNNIKVRKQVENLPIKGNVQQPLDKAIHITSTNFVTVYYEVEEQNNSDVFALKGENALGDLFYVPFQTNEDNSANVKPDIAFSSIVLLATEDNTVIDVYPTNEVLGFGSSPFTITLDKGQSISLLPGPANV